jgi:response regulator RpfG family c-di-GMP phosphodiesterase
MMLRELLRECGYRVLEAASTDEAIAVLEKTAIPVDVVLSEIDIAGLMNGVGFAQWARSIRPELKILLAGTPERTVRNAVELCEVGPTLKRPYDHKLVLDRIKRLLAARAQQGGRGLPLLALRPRWEPLTCYSDPPLAISRDDGARNTRSSFRQQLPWSWSS